MDIERELIEIRRIAEATMDVANETFTVVSRIERKVDQLFPKIISVEFGKPTPKKENEI